MPTTTSTQVRRAQDAEFAGHRMRLPEKEGPRADAGKPQGTYGPTTPTRNAKERQVIVVAPQDRILEYYNQVFQDDEDCVSNDDDTPARSFDMGPYQYPPEFPIDPESPNWLSHMMAHFQNRRKHLLTLRGKLTYYVQSVLRAMALTKIEVEEENKNMAALLQKIEKIAGERICRQLEKSISEEGKGDPGSESEVEFDIPENVKPASAYRGYNGSAATEVGAYPEDDSAESQADSILGSSRKRKRDEAEGPVPGEISSKRLRDTPKGTPRQPLRPLPRLSFDNMPESDDEDEYESQDTTGAPPQRSDHMQEPMIGSGNTVTQGSAVIHCAPGNNEEITAPEAAASNAKRLEERDLGVFSFIAPRAPRTPSPSPRHRPKRPIVYTPFPSRPEINSQDDLGLESADVSPAAGEIQESIAEGCVVGMPDLEPVSTVIPPEL